MQVKHIIDSFGYASGKFRELNMKFTLDAH